MESTITTSGKVWPDEFEEQGMREIASKLLKELDELHGEVLIESFEINFIEQKIGTSYYKYEIVAAKES